MRRRVSLQWNELGAFARVGVVVLGLVFAALIAVFVLKWMPELLANDDLPAKERAEDEGRNRTALLATLAGVLAAIGAYYTHRTFQLNRQTYEHARETARLGHDLDRAGQITERFTRAIDQLGATDHLGKPKVDVVLGGIYALERIAKDSEDDHPQVVEVLTAYVREHARYNRIEPQAPKSGDPGRDDEATSPDDDDAPPPAIDIQAAMDVLARRDITRDREHHSLNLAGTDLTRLLLDAAEGGHLERANLSQAHLEQANLNGTHLEHANLREANLKGTKLARAHLKGADLSEAHLEHSDLSGARLGRAFLMEAHLAGADLSEAHLAHANLGAAHLKKAFLRGAHLKGANLIQADLEGAGLRGAHLEGANLSGAHLDGVLYDDDTRWGSPEAESEARASGARHVDEDDEIRSAPPHV